MTTLWKTWPEITSALQNAGSPVDGANGLARLLAEKKLIEKNEIHAWQVCLGKLRTGKTKVLKPEKQEKIDQLLELVSRKSTAPEQNNDAARGKVLALRSFLKREDIGGMVLAGKFKETDEDHLELAQQIDEFLISNGPLPPNLFQRIANHYDVDPETLEPKESFVKPQWLALGNSLLGKDNEGFFILIKETVKVRVANEQALTLLQDGADPKRLLQLLWKAVQEE